MNNSKIKYPKHYIDKVICRIDFLEYLQTEEVFDPNVIKEITKNFPRKEKDQLMKFNSINIEIGSKSQIPALSGQL
jgi:hypothetical protein